MVPEAVSTHSRPEAAGILDRFTSAEGILFQLTAARRRLGSTDSDASIFSLGFNSQPPGGGWIIELALRFADMGFNSQPPGGGWSSSIRYILALACFNSQPPGGGWHLELSSY